MRRYPKISVSASLYLMLPIALLLIPFPWIIGFWVAITIHELGHYIALRFFKIAVHKIEVSGFGIEMETESVSPGCEFVCALAGPIAGFLLIGIAKYFPQTAICGLFHSIINLFPVYPSDGGRALRALLCCIFPEKLASRLERILLVVFCMVAIYITVRFHLGVLPYGAVAVILYRNFLQSSGRRGTIGKTI